MTTTGAVEQGSHMRSFFQVLVNTMVANVTTSFLWFALTFWVYLETRNVMATGIVGGAYMLLVAIFAMVFGTLVDRHRKRHVFVFSSAATAVAFVLAWLLFLWQPEAALLDFGGPWFWLFAGIILVGAVVEQMRNIALSTTVTLLVPVERHANANGMVGTVQGLAFIVTSVFSGLAIGFLGMGGTLVIAVALTVISLVHILFVRIPESAPEPDPDAPSALDFRGSVAAIRAVPGLFVLLFFAMFNNLIGGVYMALMDPYGLELMPVQWWGIVFGVASTGFIVGGILVSARGLGRNPIRTMLLLVAVTGVIGSLFAIRDWWVLYAVGIWVYMALMPAIEAAEQTVIQKVVPYRRQGRVFGLASAMEASAAPITAFLIAPIAQYAIIPFVESAEGRAAWGWLVGDGQARGIAVIFFFAGLVTIALAAFAFTTRAYRTVSSAYAEAPATAEPTTEVPA
ncbi:MFS transporter [Microbacterium pseudoresistens]|uniref:DHA3 family multidrug efflux protein-like MFS transporter n=1 Tax=Microbacterium pseudoresistens TaxID=640634 RepID=A0A7Y9ETR9_9MICO|nr:MFS transporter [Microbacterium pseudoresistens]NYD53644.1 DHA3 family multidrug efflux protein-like MFS transporter [Microbacterium pseudoresistens]